jgi:ATP-binding cassette subfamily B protein
MRGPRPGGGHGGFGGPPQKSKNFKVAFRRLFAEIGSERKIFSIVIALISSSVIIGAFGPKILGKATNYIFEGYMKIHFQQGSIGNAMNMPAIRRIVITAIAIYAISALFSWIQGYLLAGITQRTIYRLREKVEQKIGRLPLSYFDGQSRGDLLSRVTNDIDNIGMTLQQGLSQIINSILTVVTILAMMIWISPLLALVSLVAIPLSMFTSIIIAKKSQKEFMAQWEFTGKLNGHVEEMHTGHSLVKVFGRRKIAIQEFEELNHKLTEASFRAGWISGFIQPFTQLINNLIYVGIAVVGGYQVTQGTMKIGDVQAFIQYSRQFGMPLAQLAGLTSMVQSGIASAERIFEVLDAVDEISDPEEVKVINRAKGKIEFRKIAFRYVADQPLIEKFSLKVKPGQTVAIVGPTGAGKTTLVNLLMRFYDVWEGSILLDGIDIRELSRDNLRSQFGMVLQDTWLFTGSMKENIGYGAENPDQEKIESAARAANIDHFLRSLPNGYESMLTDDNSTVSNGERQLLTIARAFMADPAILILDEATSSVDTRTEVLVQEAMAKLRKGRTSFVIAHRLSTIRDADVILVMDHGGLVEQGTHEELMAAKGFYFNLYASQFASTSEG